MEKVVVSDNIWIKSFLFHMSSLSSAPQEIAGHKSAIKKALWCNNDKQILSAAEDKTIRSVNDTVGH